LARVRERALAAFEHEDLPFEKLVEELQPERHLSQTPLFQAVLVVQKAVVPQAMCEGLRFDPQALAKGTSQFDLTLLLEEGDLELDGRFEYSTDLFEPATVHRWASHLRQLMVAVAEEPQRDVFDLPLLDPAQRHQVLRQWNDTTRRFPLADQPAHRLVAHQASIRPDAIAVEWADEHLSYGELQRRARRRADGLTAQGLGAEAMVGLCATRSPRLVEALLAIFEAGGVYVPIDPGHPPERQRHVLESCRAAWLLTDQAASTETVPPGIARIDLHHRPPLAAPSAEVPRQADRTLAQQLAYVLYTSGSTGEPKGAMITHGAFSNLLLWTVDALDLGPNDRFLKRAPVSFDASVWELLMPLVCGGRLVLAGPGSERDPAQLVRELADRRIDNALLVPTLANLVLQQPGLRRGVGLRRLFSGGEALTRDLAERLDTSTLTRGEIVNLYGPTEACVVMTMARFVPSTPDHAAPTIDGATVPIGHAITNTQAYGLDPELRPQPVGVPGELFIGGVCLARGYLNDPRQTAESFIPDPFGTAGRRLYRSGDLVRSRSDGSWTFLRRRDDQIKLRGLRIEPGEIEVALNAHPAIRRAVLTVQAVEGVADRRLVAWLVAESTGERTAAPLASADLRRFLAPTLPDYMVPSVYQWLDALPATPTGKVDRKALRQRAIADAEESRATAPKPSTPTEEILLGLCAEILGREQVGIDDSFFDLGGHSLLAIQLVARIREVFAIELAVREVFEISDLAALAQRLEDPSQGGSDAQGPPLEATPRDETDPDTTWPLSYAQEQLWFLDQWRPGGWEYNVNQVFRLNGPLHRTALDQALGAIERHHEVLRTIFRVADEEPRQQITPWCPRQWLTEVDLGRLDSGPADVLTWLDDRARQPFDLRHGPLWRALLVDAGDGERFLFLSFHHIVFDGWSQGVFLHELAQIYRANIGGRVPSLPKLAVQYADFAEWHRRWLSTEVLEREVAWWREHLAEAPELAELPTDRPRPTEWRGAGGVLPVRLPHPTAERLAETARQSRVTLFMLLLAAFDALIARLSGQSQVVVGSPVAGRTQRQTEDLIGFFVNLLPLRLDLDGDPTFLELLTRVRSVALGAYAHQQVPFEKLVEELRPERRRDRNPLFQISFALQESSHQPTNLGEIELQPLDLSTDRAKFDLTLGLEETPEGLEGLVEYCADLFDRTTAERLARGFERLVQGAVADPGRRLSELPVLAQGERHQLQTEWNDTGRSPADRPTLPERFAAQAERMPEAVAVVYRDEAVSFGQLA
ncbi:MAG: amino acid adenylation domain-containing protein, partial [Acidobacteriota bacterium]